MKKVLTIAGSDCSGGAGIQADLKTIMAHKLYGMSVITALTAQNTTGVRAIQDCTPEFVAAQLDAVFDDIFPDAVKIGMVSSADIIEVIADKLKTRHAANIVIDPVMVATSGSSLLQNSAVSKLVSVLLPFADLITPNLAEAQVLAGIPITTESQMEEAAKRLSQYTKGSILIKGGHLNHAANDLLFTNNKCIWFKSERIVTDNTHGTGCTLSSAIASNLALGYSIEESVQHAKSYITGALKAGLRLGSGNGPLSHVWNL